MDDFKTIHEAVEGLGAPVKKGEGTEEYEEFYRSPAGRTEIVQRYPGEDPYFIIFKLERELKKLRADTESSEDG